MNGKVRARAIRALDPAKGRDGLRFSTLGQVVYGDTSVGTASRPPQAFCRPGAQVARALEREGLVTIGADRDGFTQVQLNHHGRAALELLTASKLAPEQAAARPALPPLLRHRPVKFTRWALASRCRQLHAFEDPQPAHTALTRAACGYVAGFVFTPDIAWTNRSCEACERATGSKPATTHGVNPG